MSPRTICKRSMRILSVMVPQPMMEMMDALVEGGYYKSRSELVRTALRDFLLAEIKRLQLEQDRPWRLDYGHE